MNLKLFLFRYDFKNHINKWDDDESSSTFRRLFIVAKDIKEAKTFFNYFIKHNNYIIPDDSITCEKMRKTKKYNNYYSDDYYKRELNLFKSWGLLED